MFKLFVRSLVLFCTLALNTAQAGLITTSLSGNLVFTAVAGHGGTSDQEFGIVALGGALNPVFTLHLVDGNLATTSPQATVNMGLFSSGSSLDFYNLSSFDGPKFAFSANLAGSPTPSDLVVFTDIDHSLGFGGSVVEVLGDNHWLLHLDDAASFAYDDDDNELLIDVQAFPLNTSVPEPGTFAMTLLGLGAVVAVKRRRPHA